MTMPRLLDVGWIVKPHGLRGDVVVHLVTNRNERLAQGMTLEVAQASPGPGAAGPGAAGPADGPGGSSKGVGPRPTQLVVARSRPHQQRWIVSFSGVDTIEAAQVLRGSILRAPALEDPDVLWVHDMVDAEVFDDGGQRLGRVEAVQSNPASDLLVLDNGGLIPLVFVLDRQPGRLVVKVPEGLLD